jgi:hypothetical protein
MKDNMMRPSDWPNMQPHDPVKQLFDRVFERRAPRDVTADDPTVAPSVSIVVTPEAKSSR